MYLKKFLMLLVFAIFLSPLSLANANDKPSVAVLPFNDQSPKSGVVKEDEILSVREDVEFEIVQTGKFRPLTRMEIDKLLNEIHFDNSGLVDPATAAQYGKMVGARYLVLGSVTGISDKKQYTAHVTLRMIEVETAEIYLAGRGTGKSKKSSLEAIQQAVNDALNGQRGMLTMLRR